MRETTWMETFFREVMIFEVRFLGSPFMRETTWMETI